MEISNEVAIKKPKRLTSVVWNHFERVKKADSCYAVCVHCNKKLSGSSNSGTTHLRNHLMRCLKRSSNYDVTQLLAVKRKKKDNTVTVTNISFDEGQRKEEYIKPIIVKHDQDQKRDEFLHLGGSRKFDQERSQHDLARMIIHHGYPLAMTEHVGFRVFVQNLQPMFEVNSNYSVETSCMEIYMKEKQRVYETISRLQGRINIAVEKWGSEENAEYLCLTAHFIDEDWQLHKKILNFITLDPTHTEEMLSEVIVKSLMEWDMECKLFSMTFDDCSTDDDIIIRIKDQISQTRPLFGNGQLFDVRSAAHVLRSMVQESTEALRDVTQKIRESISYVRSSQLTLAKFNELSQQVGITTQKSLLLDNPNRWNSTYAMLETAIEFKNAFCVLQEHDPAYTSALTDSEWEWARSVSGYLKYFVKITNILSANKSPTANVYFPEICDIHIQLIEWCKTPDEFLNSIASKMKSKFDKYWSKCSLSLAVAAILDPRFKMKLVEYYYSQIYGSTALDKIKEVSDGIKELFHSYTVCSTLIDEGSLLGSCSAGTSNDTRDRLRGFDKFLHETSQSQNASSDLDKYLEELVFPRNCEFDILNWWRVHTPRYPLLSMMARDVLGTPMSTVQPESAFCTGGRILDIAQSSLNPNTQQALICARDWLLMESDELNPSSISSRAIALSIEAS